MELAPHLALGCTWHQPESQRRSARTLQLSSPACELAGRGQIHKDPTCYWCHSQTHPGCTDDTPPWHCEVKPNLCLTALCYCLVCLLGIVLNHISFWMRLEIFYEVNYLVSFNTSVSACSGRPYVCLNPWRLKSIPTELGPKLKTSAIIHYNVTT